MWTCSDLKKNAWKVLSPNYWWGLLLVFLYTIIVSTASSVVSGITGIFSSVFSMMITSASAAVKSNASVSDIVRVFMPIVGTMMVISFISSLAAYAIVIFLANPLACGRTKWFITEREQKGMHSVEALFYSFRKDKYRHLVSGMAWKLLWTYLWSLVSIIPILFPTVISILFAMKADAYVAQMSLYFRFSTTAVWIVTIIILVVLFLISVLISIMINLNRYYAYFYVPYILLDEPDIGCRDALKKSLRMTDGQKGRIFILDLSFIGWWCLVSLTCGFLAIALYPYLYATYTELYFYRKEEFSTCFPTNNA